MRLRQFLWFLDTTRRIIVTCEADGFTYMGSCAEFREEPEYKFYNDFPVKRVSKSNVFNALKITL